MARHPAVGTILDGITRAIENHAFHRTGTGVLTVCTHPQCSRTGEEMLTILGRNRHVANSVLDVISAHLKDDPDLYDEPPTPEDWEAMRQDDEELLEALFGRTLTLHLPGQEPAIPAVPGALLRTADLQPGDRVEARKAGEPRIMTVTEAASSRDGGWFTDNGVIAGHERVTLLERPAGPAAS
ncbi:hypothetical protein V6N00_12475 [Tersicoccus sp. MR15.9]|uniref:hypothetical protein n=1 Tax=Tersicoccus mangrovi TaxID=3121635 RepID=UPI002FE58531